MDGSCWAPSGQLVHRLVEIEKRRRRNAVGAEAEIDFVQIEFEDLLLGIGALDLEREQRFLDLALERDLVGQKEVLGDLLGDGGGALRSTARAVGLHVEDAGAGDAGEVEAVVLIEVLVLRRDEGVDHHLRDGLDWDVEPALRCVFGDQRTIGRMHARHHRRLVVLQLRVIREILGEMPEQACGGANANQEHDRADSKQEAAKAQQKSHSRRSISTGPTRADPARSRIAAEFNALLCAGP
jgi:hypothetical protein